MLLNKRNRMRVRYMLFLLPCILMFLIFYAYPTVTVFVSCFTSWKMGEEARFIGLENFIKIFQNDMALISLKNTLLWLLIFCTIHIWMCVLIALLLRKNTRFRRFVKVCYLIPNMISLSVIGLLFYFVFNPSVGVINAIVKIFIPDFSWNWYMQESTAFLTVTLTNFFYGGLSVLLLSSEIAAIPGEVLESAVVDGATNFQINTRIILPMMKNIIGTTTIFAAVNCLKNFEIVYMTTNGGPGKATMNMPILIYRTSMMDSNYGYGNALSVVTILIGMFAILLISRIFRIGKEV